MITKQLSFSTLWDGFATNEEARKARDAEYAVQKANGFRCKRSVLRGQIKRDQYDQDDGICDVYMLDVETIESRFPAGTPRIDFVNCRGE